MRAKIQELSALRKAPDPRAYQRKQQDKRRPFSPSGAPKRAGSTGRSPLRRSPSASTRLRNGNRNAYGAGLANSGSTNRRCLLLCLSAACAAWEAYDNSRGGKNPGLAELASSTREGYDRRSLMFMSACATAMHDYRDRMQ